MKDPVLVCPDSIALGAVRLEAGRLSAAFRQMGSGFLRGGVPDARQNF